MQDLTDLFCVLFVWALPMSYVIIGSLREKGIL
jgi:hypothetical protein